ncbi:MAG: 2-succinyl-5-enolpyruvyl-6-hydroxy-3-cyclohexene-1-carboxylic-acid synthase [Bifidobacteriaceae bacterium]|jgi:2-succinyl-5-enolpyruvyl-6-hydroxy-3-cyclohexene-1-carboxylate synthase|nr:2-succinyl-5-enolpyruvyl-6-hydroxy-3-cyclohexene-1-carboxylic-acid synthase [Bifidobacteriaceae bacterium]
MSAAVESARSLLAGAVAGGLRRIVFAPGSRSAPLVYAAIEAAGRGEVEVVVRTDERVAGFTALGMAAASGEAAAVVTTSGTAVANLHPAVMEAAGARWPLLAITADRPAESHGVGANQTADQRGVFGPAPVWGRTLAAQASPDEIKRAGRQAVAAALGRRSGIGGPAHVNIQFREPLTPGTNWSPPIERTPPGRVALDQEPPPAGDAAQELLPVELEQGPRTVVVAGFGAGPAARRLAEAAGWPLLAEPASGSWGGPNAITAGRLVARLLADGIERLVVYGRPVISRSITDLVQDPRLETVIVHPGGGPWFDLGRRAGRIAARVTTPRPPGPKDRAWLEDWRRAGRTVWQELRAVPWPNGPAVAAVVARAGRGPLVVGASSAIRDLDLTRPPERTRALLAMRGLAGIDGTVSFAGGVGAALAGAAQRAESGPPALVAPLARDGLLAEEVSPAAEGGPAGTAVTVLLGDLTLAHDSGGLAIPVHEPRPDLRIVVLEDAGGAIFENLEVAAPHLDQAFERFFAAPVRLDLAELAAAHGAAFTRARTASQLAAALSQPVSGISLVGVPLDRSHRRGFERRILELSRNALGPPRKLPAIREDSSRMTRFD